MAAGDQRADLATDSAAIHHTGHRMETPSTGWRESGRAGSLLEDDGSHRASLVGCLAGFLVRLFRPGFALFASSGLLLCLLEDFVCRPIDLGHSLPRLPFVAGKCRCDRCGNVDVKVVDLGIDSGAGVCPLHRLHLQIATRTIAERFAQEPSNLPKSECE